MIIADTILRMVFIPGMLVFVGYCAWAAWREDR